MILSLAEHQQSILTDQLFKLQPTRGSQTAPFFYEKKIDTDQNFF